MTDPLEILQAVKTFYESAFSQLLTLTAIILGFGGVILPVLLQFIQSRTFRVETSHLESQVTAMINLAKDELKIELEKKFILETERLQKNFMSQIDVMNLKMQKQTAVAQAGTFFLQAANAIRLGNFDHAARDYAHSAKLAFEGEDDQNGQRALNALLEKCMSHLNSQSFEIISELDPEIDNLLETLKSRNQNGRFKDSISGITVSRNQAKKRTVPTI